MKNLDHSKYLLALAAGRIPPEVEPGLCRCGCGQRTELAPNNSNGRVKGQPYRYVAKHGKRVRPCDLLNRVEVRPDGCWIWTRAKTDQGYGSFAMAGRTYRAHRWFYEHFIGPVPEGLHLDHLCRNRACCNPGHLEPVTSRENTLRSPIAITALKARQTHCIHGHEFTPENTRRVGNQRFCRTCSREEGRRFRERAKAVAA